MIRRGFPHAADAFADALDGRARGPLDAEVQELVQTAELLCRSAVAEPTPEFSAALRARLMTEAADVLVVARPTTSSPSRVVAQTGTRRRRVVGVTAALVAGLGTVGLVTSSATAVPGDVLYPVKRTVESIQVSMHRDAESRGEYRLQQARERLAEVVQLQTDGDAQRITPTLETFAEQATAGSGDLFDAYRDESSATAVAAVNDFVAAASVELAEMASTMPEAGKAGWAEASVVVTGLADTATSLCSTCDAADVSTLTDLVQSIATGDAPAGTKPTTPTASGAPTQVPTSVPTGGLPSVAVPQPGSSATPNVVGDTVDGLLGEDGLVPNIVGGLLGTKKQ